MGWWSATIMGGDFPCDMMAELEDVLGLEDEKEYSEEQIRDLINAKQHELFQAVQARENNLNWPPHAGITGQVLAVFILHFGATMTEEIRAYLIECAEKDEWAKQSDGETSDSSERKRHIDDLISKLRQYPLEGAATPIAHETLFDKFEKMIENGTEGLANTRMPQS